MNPIDGSRHALMCANAQALPVPDTASEQIATGSVVNVCKLTKKGFMPDEKREQINAKRRAAYHKKKKRKHKNSCMNINRTLQCLVRLFDL